MLDKLMKLKEMKQGSGEMRPVEKNAKMSVLKDLIGEAGNEMSMGLKNSQQRSPIMPSQPKKDEENQVDKFMGNGISDDISPEDADEMSDSMSSPENTPEELGMSAEELSKKIESLMKLKADKDKMSASSDSEGY